MSSPSASTETTETLQMPQESLAPSDSTPQNNDNAEQHIEKPLHSPLPLRKYTRQQLVSLSNSPLVKPPPNMPELKVWFGSENENLMKKDEPPTPSTARERRFRRDAEDADGSSRPAFRTALSQPSQMGNFKHQSLRANDRDKERDRERDGEKEREREIREKEGHERLRHLSDKFDRDRLALPLANARKEREAAPHLNANNPRTTQTLTSNAASRRAETREATKKKVGEASEDWRRGAEPPRSTREDRTENGRREDRDRARSRARDTSRPKREASVSRRERDEKAPRGDRERDDHRRDKDESRRDRDVVDVEEDPRRWRDDGKRDERMAARRDRDRGRDKNGHEHNWEGTTDKRLTAGDERDGRYKRSSGRDRKSGNTADDIKEKEERREREREKEPAWMDTYVPSDTTPGILGGQSSTGELDGIQAWKKGMKEKESKDKDASVAVPSKEPGLEKEVPSTLPETAERPPMDEIQLFKLLMKKEEEKKKTDTGVEVAVKNEHAPVKGEDATSSTQQRQRNPDKDSSGEAFPSESIRKVDLVHSQVQNVPAMDSSPLDTPPSFSLTMKDPVAVGKSLPGLNPSPDRNLLQAKLPALGANLSQLGPGKQSGDSEATNFQPPPGSRLLAFARPPIKGGISGNPANLQVLNGGLPSIAPESAQGYAKNEPVRPPSGFSPFEDQTRQGYAFDESRESGLPLNLNLHPRTNIDAFNSNPNAQVEQNHNGMAAVKGSRFAKFFDGKGRDGLPSSNKPHLPGGLTSPSPNHNHRQEQISLVTGSSGDQRAMDELFAMLNNSSQRGNLGHHSNPNPLLNNNGVFGTQGPSLNTLQQQHLLQQQSQHHNRLEPRLESLYDSRADDRSFMPDGMVPGLRPIPPPPTRGRDGHFVEQVDEQMHYNFQRIPQQAPLQQARNLDPLYSGPGPLFAQQGGRPTGGLNLQSLQQPHYRGGPSPLNQGVPLSSGQQQQRLPPGLANLGGRPPHEPSQFLGLPGLPSNAPHNALHANGPPPHQQLPFNNFNGVNNINFNSSQVRGPVPGPNLHHTGAQQHPLGNLGHPNMDPRLSNHHHLMGLGGSGVTGNRINGGFLQQGPAAPSHITMRQQQQQQQQQPHLPPHMLPHLMPPHLQQGHPANNPPNPDLMALLLGGSHRE